MPYSNRGRYFEDLVAMVNQQYNERGLAVIHKIPTPWQVTRKRCPFKNTYEIASAFPKEKSTVDFGGTAAKQSIWFDVKVTTNKHSFPLHNVHKHQIQYLEKVDAQGGKAFFLIHSEQSKKTWLLWISDLVQFIKTNERKSIPFKWFDTHCTEIKSRNGIAIDYLPEVLKLREG